MNNVLVFIDNQITKELSDGYFCSQASARVSRKIAESFGINFHDLEWDDILIVGLFSFTISSYFCSLLDQEFEAISTTSLVFVFMNPEDMPDKMADLIKLVDPVVDFYNRTNDGSNFPTILGTNFARFVQNPTIGNWTALTSLFEMARGSIK